MRVPLQAGLACLVFLTHTTTVQAKNLQDLEFKGVAVGKTVAKETVQNSLQTNCGDGSAGMVVCNGVGSIAGQVAETNVVIGVDGVLDRIRLVIDSDGYSNVVQALTTKFGKASRIQRSAVQNRLGTVFQSEHREWKGPSGTLLQADKFDGDTEHSVVYFSTARDRKLMEGGSESNDL